MINTSLINQILSYRPSIGLLKWFVVVGVIGVSASLAFSPNMLLLVLPAVLIIGIGALIILLKAPILGLFALIGGSLLVPSPFERYGYGINLNTTVLIVGGLAVVGVVDMVVRQKKFRLARSRTMPPLLGFLIVVIIAFISGQLRYYYLIESAPLTAQVAGTAVFVLSGLAYLLAGNIIKDLKWLEWLCWFFVVLGAVYVFGRLHIRLERIIRPLFQYGSDASMFWTWMVAISASQALFNKQLSQRTRIWLGIILALTLYVSVGKVQTYEWKSGWIPALVTLAAILFIGEPRFRIPAVLLGVVALVFGFSNLSSALTGGEEYSITTRWEAWGLILEIAKVNPLLGLGPANYYHYTPLFSILGYSVNFSSHNNYIDIFAQTGLVGLLFFTWFLFTLTRLSIHLLSRVPDGFPKAYLIGVIGALAGMIVSGLLGDWFLPFVYNVGVGAFRSSGLHWFYLGGIVILEKLYMPVESPGWQANES
jgi:hypothetical protein